jgi:hypothetical protein
VSANGYAARTARKYGLGYHDVRIAVNQLVNAGHEPKWVEGYIDETLAQGYDLDRVVAIALEVIAE